MDAELLYFAERKTDENDEKNGVAADGTDHGRRFRTRAGC